MKLNEKIFENRKKLGLSQEDLANKLDVSRQTVSKWEVGSATPEVEKIVKLSDIFNVSVDYLVKENEEKYIKKGITINKKLIVNILLGLLVVLSIVLGINKLIDITKTNLKSQYALEMINTYMTNGYEVGQKHSGRILIDRELSKGNNVTLEKAEYYYYINGDDRLLKYRPYDDDLKTVSKEYFINLNNVDCNRYEENKIVYDNVVELNLEDYSQRVINDYEIEFISSTISGAICRSYSIVTTFRPELTAKAIAENESVEMIKSAFAGKTSYHMLYGDYEKDEDYLWLSITEDFTRIISKTFDNDIFDKKEFLRIDIIELNFLDKAFVLPPEE
ncbi:MAG: helix-turn-helix transcriptional regulator [Clostridia bacterium]|nr:helix-turn-helix transcriptional regulator [Clostridia bacterium]